MRVVAGRRPRHDAAGRSRRLLAANKRELGVAELLSGIVHHGVEHGTDPLTPAKDAWRSLLPVPFRWTDDEFRTAVTDLTALADDYSRGGALELTWPARLTSPVPAARPAHPRGRRGRV